MQPLKYLYQWMMQHADNKHYLFKKSDLRALFPSLTEASFKTLLSRATRAGILARVCRGVYLYAAATPTHGLILFHTATLLRADEFNYISLETVLSAVGIISQIPTNWISILTSGRSNTIACGKWGTIEFIHTKQKPIDVMEDLIYDNECQLWRATPALALRDMKTTHRNCDLIDWDIADEFI